MNDERTTGQEIVYVTLWENEWDSGDVAQFLDNLTEAGVNTVAFDIRWGLHEPSENTFDFSSTQDICRRVTERGFRLMPLVSIYYGPGWIFEKYPDIVELDSKQWSGQKNMSCAHPRSMPLALSFIGKCLEALDPYRDQITAISVSWNNEHETKFTQTHDRFRPYEPAANTKFEQYLSERNGSIEYWNKRWSKKFKSFGDAKPKLVNGAPTKDQIQQARIDGQYIFDLYAFRRELLIECYTACCRLIQSSGYQTWLHFGEMFSCVDAIYQGDIVFHMIDKEWLDIVVIDSNMSKLACLSG